MAIGNLLRKVRELCFGRSFFRRGLIKEPLSKTLTFAKTTIRFPSTEGELLKLHGSRNHLKWPWLNQTRSTDDFWEKTAIENYLHPQYETKIPVLKIALILVHVRIDRQNRCFRIAVFNTCKVRLAGYMSLNDGLQKVNSNRFFWTMLFLLFSLSFLRKKWPKRGVTPWPFFGTYSG